MAGAVLKPPAGLGLSRRWTRPLPLPLQAQITMQPPRQPEGLPLAIGCKFILPHLAEHRRQVLEDHKIFRMPLQPLAHQTRGPSQIPQFKDVVDQPADLAGIGPG